MSLVRSNDQNGTMMMSLNCWETILVTLCGVSMALSREFLLYRREGNLHLVGIAALARLSRSITWKKLRNSQFR